MTALLSYGVPLFTGPAVAVFAMVGPFQRILGEVLANFRAKLALRCILCLQLLYWRVGQRLS
jgi:hypothetical protein